MKRAEKRFAVAAIVVVIVAVVAVVGIGPDGDGAGGVEKTDAPLLGSASIGDSSEEASGLLRTVPQEAPFVFLGGNELIERDASLPGAEVSLPPICSESGILESTARSGLGVRATWNVDTGLVEAAGSVLGLYRDAGGCVLAYDGYLDLMGRVWGCVVRSDEGWVECAIVDERELDDDGNQECDVPQSCSVTVVRFSAP